MATTVIWISGITLELLILSRCVKTGSFRVYPFFFAYLACVFAGDVALIPLSRVLPKRLYADCYWAKEFLCVIAGYAVVMEIIERAFAHYEGPKRLGRNAALIIFTAIVACTALQAAFQQVSHPGQNSFDVEASLRGAELILLAIVIAVMSYYRIPLGKNLKGITIGYGICTAAVVINESIGALARWSFYPAFSRVWSYSYIVSLGIWIIALWSYEPNPVPEGPNRMGGDYEALANRTRTALAGMRGHLGKAARP
jgi:hypothetical protein